MRAAGVGATIAAGVIAACFSTPDRPNGQQRDGAPDDSLIDVSGSQKLDAPTDSRPGCALVSFSTSVTSGCGTWATPASTFGAVEQQSGHLFLQVFTGSASGSATCKSAPQPVSSVTFDIKGVFASTTQETTYLGVQSPAGLRWGVTVANMGSATPTWNCPGAVGTVAGPWSALNNRYVRIDRNTGGTVTIYTGSDTSNLTNSPISCVDGSNSFDAIAVAASIERSGSGNAGSAVLDEIEICP